MSMDEADRRVAESERLAADWAVLIEQMQAEGRDVTVALDLLEALQADVHARRCERDAIARATDRAAAARPVFARLAW